MKLHANAPLSPKGRQLLIDRDPDQRVNRSGMSQSLWASAKKTARKLLTHYQAEGPDGLIDRSSAPRVVANRTDEQTIHRKPRRGRARAADRQQLGIPLHGARDRLQSHRHPSPAHPA